MFFSVINPNQATYLVNKNTNLGFAATFPRKFLHISCPSTDGRYIVILKVENGNRKLLFI